MASYPNSIKNFTTRQNGEYIDASIVNDLQDEVVAVETELKKTTAATSVNAADSAKLGGVNASDLLSGWIPSPGLDFGDPSATPSAGFCLVSGGVVNNVFAVGDKIKFTQDGITKYAYVVSLHSDWLLKIYGGSDYTFTSNTVTNAYYSHATSPLGFPQWFDYVPTLNGGSAALSTCNVARFCIKGKELTLIFSGGGTVTGAGAIRISTPATVVGTTVSTWVGYPGTGGGMVGMVALESGGYVTVYNDSWYGNWAGGESGVAINFTVVGQI